MADNGSLYDGYDMQMCDVIREFCFKADVITPNTTELAILAHKGNPDVLNEKWVNDYSNIEKSLNMLYKKGLSKIVVTGYKENGAISNIILITAKFPKSPTKRSADISAAQEMCFQRF